MQLIKRGGCSRNTNRVNLHGMKRCWSFSYSGFIAICVYVCVCVCTRYNRESRKRLLILDIRRVNRESTRLFIPIILLTNIYLFLFFELKFLFRVKFVSELYFWKRRRFPGLSRVKNISRSRAVFLSKTCRNTR